MLVAFVWLVSKHSEKLYGPRDFRNEDNYMKLQATKLQTAALIGAATAASQKLTNDKQMTDDKSITEIVDFIQISSPAEKKNGARLRNNILWVDDIPENNIYLRKAFEAMGLKVTLASSTREAFEKLSQIRYATIISDMKRREGPREGYELLDRMRGEENHTPLFFYSSRVEPQHTQETLSHGGQGCTDDPHELFRMVITAVGTGALNEIG